jgi:hypothetical protein
VQLARVTANRDRQFLRAAILEEQFHMSPTSAGKYSGAFDWIGFLGVIDGGDWMARAIYVFCVAATIYVPDREL